MTSSLVNWQIKCTIYLDRFISVMSGVFSVLAEGVIKSTFCLGCVVCWCIRICFLLLRCCRYFRSPTIFLFPDARSSLYLFRFFSRYTLFSLDQYSASFGMFCLLTWNKKNSWLEPSASYQQNVTQNIEFWMKQVWTVL